MIDIEDLVKKQVALYRAYDIREEHAQRSGRGSSGRITPSTDAAFPGRCGRGVARASDVRPTPPCARATRSVREAAAPPVTRPLENSTTERRMPGRGMVSEAKSRAWLTSGSGSATPE